MKKILIIIFSVLIFSLTYLLFKGSPRQGLSVIMVAFGYLDEKGNWGGEVAPYIARLENPQEISSKIPLCEKVFQGKLNNWPILLVVSGKGKVNASLCTANLLNEKGRKIKEIIFSGIAGVTPKKGGILDENKKEATDLPAMIGDVCINSFAVDVDLQHFSADITGTNDKKPILWSFEEPFTASFVNLPYDLAAELSQAAKKVSFPSPPPEVESINKKYHNQSRTPILWASNECFEATGDLFWHDIYFDTRAREIGANYLSEISELKISPDEVIVFTSMEALPVGLTVARWNERYGIDIDFAYVRAASNFTHTWLDKKGTPAVGGRESLGTFDPAYDFAIQIQALPVLKLFELRR